MIREYLVLKKLTLSIAILCILIVGCVSNPDRVYVNIGLPKFGFFPGLGIQVEINRHEKKDSDSSNDSCDADCSDNHIHKHFMSFSG